VDTSIGHLRAFVVIALVCAFLSLPALANKLRIITVPPGAAVQINGVLVGTTPYEQNIPGGYLHKTKTALGARLGYPMIARLTLIPWDRTRTKVSRRLGVQSCHPALR
jgi:hypothetical protein